MSSSSPQNNNSNNNAHDTSSDQRDVPVIPSRRSIPPPSSPTSAVPSGGKKQPNIPLFKGKAIGNISSKSVAAPSSTDRKQLPSPVSTQRQFKESQSRPEQRAAAAATGGGGSGGKRPPSSSSSPNNNKNKLPAPGKKMIPSPSPRSTPNSKLPPTPSNNSNRIPPSSQQNYNSTSSPYYDQQEFVNASDLAHQYDYRKWPCSKSPILHYDLWRFPVPLRYYCYTSYYISFWMTLLTSLLTTFSVPFVFWMRNAQFSVLVGSDPEFTEVLHYKNFLWSFLSLFVAPWFFFFFWHYPFYLAIEEQTEDEDFIEKKRQERIQKYQSRISMQEQQQKEKEDGRKKSSRKQKNDNNTAIATDPSLNEPMTPTSSPRSPTTTTGNANGNDDSSDEDDTSGQGRRSIASSCNDDGHADNKEKFLKQEEKEQQRRQQQQQQQQQHATPKNNSNEDETATLLGAASTTRSSMMNASFALATQEILIPMYKTWFSSFGAIAFFCFCVLQFIGANFLAAAGVGFLLDVKTMFDRDFDAVGKSVTDRTYYWKMIALPLIATIFWGLMMFTTLAWIIVLFRRKWKESQKKFGVGFMIVIMITAFVLLLVWIFVWDRHEFFPPTKPYQRQICLRNSCGGLVRVMATGGSTGLSCSGGCPAGTVCNTHDDLCYFAINRLSGNGLVLGPGGRQCVPFDYAPVDAQTKQPGTGTITTQNVQWSGAIYASSGCQPGGTDCRTALCDDCPAFIGPTGPVTQAEFTLVAKSDGPDYYDVTIINGVNFPMKITPMFNPNIGQFQKRPQATPMYWCQSPGATSNSINANAKSTWKFIDNLKSVGNYYPLVDASAPGAGGPCPCSNPAYTCGTAMVLVQSGNVKKPTQQVQQNVCGPLLGFWTDDELCAWTAGGFGTCAQTPSGASAPLQNLLGCDGAYATSCFQSNSDDGCCGCTVWPSLSLTPSDGFQCYHTNSVWESEVEPKLLPFKQGCPTCYTYPFDDATSTFTCRGNETVNDNSYEIEWCPDGVELG